MAARERQEEERRHQEETEAREREAAAARERDEEESSLQGGARSASNCHTVCTRSMCAFAAALWHNVFLWVNLYGLTVMGVQNPVSAWIT
jgi:hypothetical protein